MEEFLNLIEVKKRKQLRKLGEAMKKIGNKPNEKREVKGGKCFKEGMFSCDMLYRVLRLLHLTLF